MSRFYLIFFVSILGCSVVYAEDLEYICGSNEIIKISYSSEAVTYENKIDLLYKNDKQKLFYQPSFLDETYTMYLNNKYEWWEFMDSGVETGILFESKENGDILEICRIKK